MKKFTFVLAAMFAFATLGNAAETEETVYFGGAPSWAFKKFADINGPLPLSVTATADWNEVTLTDKALNAKEIMQLDKSQQYTLKEIIRIVLQQK